MRHLNVCPSLTLSKIWVPIKEHELQYFKKRSLRTISSTAKRPMAMFSFWIEMNEVTKNSHKWPIFFHLSPLGWIPVLLFCFLSFVARIFFISAKFCLLWRIASLTVRYLTKSLATQGKLDLFGIKGKEAQQDPCSVPGLWKRYFTAYPTNRAQPFLNSTFWVCNLASHVC